MSRLDYVTIAIVAVCVAALVYLIYMTTNLLGGPEEPPLTEEIPAETESYEDDTYAFDNQEDTLAQADDYSNYDYENGQDLDKGRSSTTTANEPATTSYDEPSTSTTTARGGSYGNYLVLAGTFSVKANAESMVKKLQGMGYSNAAVEPFDRGSYSVALVNRFDSYSAANDLVKELKGKGVESYVKKSD